MQYRSSWLLGILLVASAHGQTLSTGLVGYWSFNEGNGTAVADASGQGNHGTLVNGGSAWVSGHFGGGLYFPGTTGSSSTRVEVPNAASLQITSAISFAAWVRADNISSDAPILAKEGDGKLSYWFGAFGVNTEGAGPGNFGLLLDANGSQGWELYDRNQGSLSAGTWVHLASTWDGSQVVHYVNGSAIAGGAAYGTAINVSDAFLAIGANSLYNTTAFTGVIDDLYLYNRALSSTEINQLMASPIPEPAPIAALIGALAMVMAVRRKRNSAP